MLIVPSVTYFFVEMCIRDRHTSMNHRAITLVDIVYRVEANTLQVVTVRLHRHVHVHDTFPPLIKFNNLTAKPSVTYSRRARSNASHNDMPYNVQVGFTGTFPISRHIEEEGSSVRFGISRFTTSENWI